jgi:protein-tyrosine sulfotransferase
MEQIVFIGGMSRSGNNMVRNVLDSHPDITTGPETNIIDDSMALHNLLTSPTARDGSASIQQDEINQTIGAFIHSMYQPYATSSGKRIVVDRYPDSVWSFPILAKVLPNAKFIHLIRDGRDVACSHRDVGVRATTRGATLDPIRKAAVSSVYHCAAMWAETVKYGWDVSGPESSLAAEGRSFTTFYENIVLSPESQFQAICEFLGIEFCPDMIHPERFKHTQTVDGVWTTAQDLNAPISMLSAGRWIDHLSLKDRVIFYAAGQAGLEQTGYDTGLDWLFRGSQATVGEATAAVDQAKAEIVAMFGTSAPERDSRRDSSGRAALEKIVSMSEAQGSTAAPDFEAIFRNAHEAITSILGPSR